MGLSLYLENQIHGRTYAGPELSASVSRVLEKAGPGGLLAGVHIYGDTMFNMVQLRTLNTELEAIAAAHPELNADTESLRLTIQKAIRDRGYIWLSGD